MLPQIKGSILQLTPETRNEIALYLTTMREYLPSSTKLSLSIKPWQADSKYFYIDIKLMWSRGKYVVGQSINKKILEGIKAAFQNLLIQIKKS